jgi:Putative zinc-finger
MVDNAQSGMPCSEFDALLMEAVEGKLTGEQAERFRSHADVCGVCGPLFADAKSGFTWLQSLAEVEPPANLVHNILAATSERDLAASKAAAAKPGFAERLRFGLRSLVTPLLQPRLAGTFAMGFFSLSLLLNVTGVKVSDISKLDLRPSAIKKTYYATSSRVVRYYENLRLVYEVQSRVREMKEAIPTKEDEQKKDESKPERKQNQKRDDMSNRPNGSERDNAGRYQQENAAVTPVSYNPSLHHLSLKSAILDRASRNDRRTA